jgi:hypothetical protein
MSESALRVVRPVMVPAQVFLWGVLAPGLVALVVGLVVTNIVDQDREFTRRWNDGAPADMRRDPPGTTPWGVLAGIAVFAVVAGAAAVKLVIEPRYTEYRVLRDRVEYSEGFFNRSQRTVVFDQVIDVQLEEGVLQQTAGAGTVTLVTQQLVSAGREGQLTNRSFALSNVPEPKQVYDLIRSLALKKGLDAGGKSDG